MLSTKLTNFPSIPAHGTNWYCYDVGPNLYLLAKKSQNQQLLVDISRIFERVNFPMFVEMFTQV
jgi:hypothetical protein